ncbi:MAG: hypothetical protein SPF22_08165 [Candidatus Onthovivens sp.]|nr:hypothetical protein [Candidatus Onthovivens sp.]
MRIIALTKNETPVLNMANGAGISTQKIPEGEEITLTSLKKDGLNTYYFTEEYSGYVKKDNVQLIRDEEFYYSSSLLKSKSNRSATSTFSIAREAKIEDLSPSVSEFNKITPADDMGVVKAKLAAQKKELASREKEKAPVASSTSLIPSNDGGKTASATADAAGTKKSGSGIKTPSGIEVSQALTSIGTGFLGNTKLASNPIGKAGIDVLNSFASTGNWNEANNMDLGSSIFGSNSLLAGATINNISDGSFFKNQLKQNTVKMINSYLNTLLRKLDYVVGFNLSGILLNLAGGFGIDVFASSNKYGIGAYDYWRDYKVYGQMGNMDQYIEKYFKYKGANYKMITKHVNGRVWEQDAYYSTPTMLSRKDKNEVQVHHNLYNNLYTEFESSINIVKDSLNLTMDRNDWFKNFNRYRLITPDSVLGNTKGYVFFTRPDLNISSDIMSSDIGLLFFNMASQHSGIVQQLKKDLSGTHQFAPLLCNRCTGLDIQDENLEIAEVNETLTGWKLNYATNLIKSKTSGTVTTSFIDDEQLSIYLLFKLWCEYISNVSRGVITAKETYIKTKILDYAISIYYFLTAPDGESIIFWSKWTGCIPTTIPSSNFSDSIDSPVRMPKYSITWQYAFKKDYDPFTLAEFNKLTGSDFNYVGMYNPTLTRSSGTLCGAPFVDTQTGGRLFKLRFRQKDYKH